MRPIVFSDIDAAQHRLFRSFSTGVRQILQADVTYLASSSMSEEMVLLYTMTKEKTHRNHYYVIQMNGRWGERCDSSIVINTNDGARWHCFQSLFSK